MNAPVLRSQVSDEEIARRIEVVRRELRGSDLTLEEFTAKVDRLWNRQAIAAFRTACGQCFGVSIPPKPQILSRSAQ